MVRKNILGMLALTTTLTACGGGGGGGSSSFTPIQVTPLGSVNVSGLSSGFTSVIKQISQDGYIDAKETVDVFKWINANANINTTELAKYSVTVEGKVYNLEQAWNMLKGYKKLYYDGKETFWQNMIDSKKFDDEDTTYVELKAIADKDDPNFAEKIGKGTKTVEDFKKQNNIVTITNKTTETLTTTETSKKEDNTETYSDDTVDTVQDDGSTKRQTIRTVTKTKTVTTITKTFTQNLIIYTYSDKTTKSFPQEKKMTNKTETPVVTTTTDTIVLDTIIIPPANNSDNTKEKENDNKNNNEDNSNNNNSDSGNGSDEENDKTNKEEKESEKVTLINTETIVGDKIWSHVQKTLGDPITTTEDKITYNGKIKTTTRTTTVCKIEWHEHFDKIDTKIIKSYSDGAKTESVTTEYFSRGKVNKGENCTSDDEIIEQTNYDDGIIGDDHKDMGNRTPGYSNDKNSYNTEEFNYLDNKHLKTSNFDVAYSRGWTGKGSTVVIADTGADINHVDLDNNVKHHKVFYGMVDDVTNASEHGTHVSGITGAEKNNNGMHGAAFDVNLAIAKVGEGHYYSFHKAKEAAIWGKKLNAVAINLSAEMRLDNYFLNSLQKTSKGNYYSTHYHYGVNGYSGSVNEAYSWKDAIGKEMVIVKAAGNAGRDYSAGMNQMAHATDKNGNLILDGQMIIVGNWDSNNNTINGSSNKAGTVCATYENNVCIDAAKVKDFYIMANGTNVTSTKSGGGYVTMTGTSMAAPVVTGSIAVLHQMWPHMKGKHLVQLVLVTGNKNFSNYDENIHGQGLLDMDNATRPVGATGIPTTGRANGNISNISGGVVTGGVSAGQITALTRVMVLDEFDRDFYVDLGGMTQSIDTRTASVAKQMGAVNYFQPYFNGDQQIYLPVYNTDTTTISVGVGHSDGQFLGNAFKGTLGTSTDSTTVYTNIDYTNGGFYAQAGLGFTKVNWDTTNSLMKNGETVISSTATLGYEITNNNHTYGLSVSQPVTIESNNVTYSMPSSVNLNGSINYTDKDVNYKNENREIDLGVYYKYKVDNKLNINVFGEIRNNVSFLQKEIAKAGGVNVKYNFSSVDLKKDVVNVTKKLINLANN